MNFATEPPPSPIISTSARARLNSRKPSCCGYTRAPDRPAARAHRALDGVAADVQRAHAETLADVQVSASSRVCGRAISRGISWAEAVGDYSKLR